MDKSSFKRQISSGPLKMENYLGGGDCGHPHPPPDRHWGTTVIISCPRLHSWAARSTDRRHKCRTIKKHLANSTGSSRGISTTTTNTARTLALSHGCSRNGCEKEGVVPSPRSPSRLDAKMTIRSVSPIIISSAPF